MNNETNQPRPAPLSESSTPICTFDSPKAGIPDQHQHKTTVIVDDRDYRKLDSWRNRPGTFVRTIAIITRKLVTALEQQQLNDYDPDRYEQLINDCSVTFSTGAITHCAVNGTPTPVPITHSNEAALVNDAGGASNLARQHPKKPPINANPKRALRRRVSKS